MKMSEISLRIALVFFAVSVIALEKPAVAVPPEETATYPVHAEKKRALQAVKQLTATLQTELRNALKNGDTEHAISICNIKANQIAAKISHEHGLTIKRISLKNRNPDNTPQEWQRKVLLKFENRKLAGEPAADLTFTDVVTNSSNQEFRFMKAIPTGPVCIRCHGTDISDKTKARLDQLYPDDKARGFRPGDIRGAFVVTIDVSP